MSGNNPFKNIQANELTQDEALAIYNFLIVPNTERYPGYENYTIDELTRKFDEKLNIVQASSTKTLTDEQFLSLSTLNRSLRQASDDWDDYALRIGGDDELMRSVAVRNPTLIFRTDISNSPWFVFLESKIRGNEAEIKAALPLFKAIIPKAPSHIFTQDGMLHDSTLTCLGTKKFSSAFAKSVFPLILNAVRKLDSQKQIETLYINIIKNTTLRDESKAVAIKCLLKLLPKKKLKLVEDFEQCVSNQNYLTAMLFLDKGAEPTESGVNTLNSAIEAFKDTSQEILVGRARELRQKIVEKKPQIKDKLLENIQSNLSKKSRAEILELFKEIKDPQGKYELLHVQRHATFDKFREKMGFFVKNQPEKELPMHTQS